MKSIFKRFSAGATGKAGQEARKQKKAPTPRGIWSGAKVGARADR